MCRQELPAFACACRLGHVQWYQCCHHITPRQAIVVQVSGLDAPDLLMRWLRELLSLHDTQRFMC